MQGWMRNPAILARVLKGFRCRDDKARFQAEQFLIHSVLANFIHIQNSKGVAIPYGFVLAQYIKLWKALGLSPIASRHVIVLW